MLTHKKRTSIIFATLIIISVIVIFLWPKQTKADGSTFFYPGEVPHNLQVSNDGTILYAGVVNGIAIIDKATMAKIDEISLPNRLSEMKINPTGEYIYGTHAANGNGTGRLSRIRLSDENVETINLSPANVWSLTFDDNGDYVYVCGGTWPNYDEGYDAGNYVYNLDTGRIFEIRISDFTLTRTINVGIDNKGISYQGGKLVIMSVEERAMERIPRDDGLFLERGAATTCHIIDAASMQTEYTIPVHAGFNNTSYALPGDIYVMAGVNCPGDDGEGFGLINVNTGEVEHWYITHPNLLSTDYYEGGGFIMTVDVANNMLYSTLYGVQDEGQSHYRIGVIDLNTNEYSDWYVEPFRLYNDILFDPASGNLYLPAPLDDAIVVLDPPA